MTKKTEGVKTSGKQSRERQQGPDLWLVLTVSVLLLIGLLAVFSVSYMDDTDDPMRFLMRQVAQGGMGVIAMLIVARMDYRFWKRASLPLMGAILIMLIAVLLVPSAYGSSRWLWKRSIQPSELAKFGMVIYIAHWASSKGEKLRQLEFGLFPFGLMVGLVTALILSEPDLSTSVLIVLTSLAMFYTAGADTKQFVLSTLIGAITLVSVVAITGYQMDRIEAWRHPTAETRNDVGRQQSLSEAALAEGGIFGQGLGHSQELWRSFPAAGFDYIFTVIGNEAGLIGGLLVISLFLILAHRGFTIALEAPDAYGTILATGITAWVTMQAFMHIAVATAAMPTTGVTLPFISLGGSSLVISLVGIGVLLSVSRGRKTANR